MSWQIKSRRTIAASLMLALLGCFAASFALTNNSKAASKKKVTIGFVQLFNQPYAIQIANGIKVAAKEYGASVKVTGPSSINPAAAISNFQNLTSSDVDGILTMGYPAELWKRPISTAVKQGINVATIDISSPGSGSSFHVGSPRQQMGAANAKLIAQKLGKNAKGQIVAGICVPGLPQLTSPIKGLQTGLKKYAPGITVKTVTTGGSPAENFAAWQRIVSDNPDALGFFGPCDQDLPSVVKLKETDKSSKWLGNMSSGGEDPVGWKAIPAGTLTSQTTQRGFVQGYVAAKLMLEHLVNGKKEPSGWIDTGYDLMTKSNVKNVAAALSSSAAAKKYYAGLLKALTNNPPTIKDENAQQTKFNVPSPTRDGKNLK